MSTDRRLFHTGLSGDRWFLCYCPEACCLYVAQELAEPAAGITLRAELHDVLRRYPCTPEQEALRRFIGNLLIDASRPQPCGRSESMPEVDDETVG